ncbi:MAG: protein phosphatase 2C domain-containing protein, partial [Fimbriimonadales bacterium]|nr:protein phosphatase 2C domain-containing protein [Fimbriimonadales bacterium]
MEPYEPIALSETEAPSVEPDDALEELVLPLEGSPPPLTAAATLCFPSGLTLRILELKQQDAGVYLYTASVEPSGEQVWLYEAHEGMELLNTQAQILQQIKSPMFPRFVDYAQVDGRVYLAVRVAAYQQTLADALRTGELSLAQTLSILAQVAAAVAQLHRLGWAHLGLRPTVIALSKPLQILDLRYVTPFGVAPQTSFYHAGYSPPELLRGEPVDGRADVYALGALLYHSVNGTPLSEHGAALSVWQPPEPVAGVPQILHRCLGAPETRYPTIEALHQDLLRLRRRQMPIPSYHFAAATSIGLAPTRATNQDAYAYLSGALETETDQIVWALTCVADGMGGMEAGELASKVAVETVVREAMSALHNAPPLTPDAHAQMARQWAIRANDAVCAALEAKSARGGATLLCACLLNQRLAIAHVGDCRLYLLRGESIQLLTQDHSLAMALALQGEVNLEAIRTHPDRSKLTRSLGERIPLPDHFVDTLAVVTGAPTMELLPNDVLLLCSDGLWEPVTEPEMLGIVQQHSGDLQAAAHALIQL